MKERGDLRDLTTTSREDLIKENKDLSKEGIQEVGKDQERKSIEETLEKEKNTEEKTEAEAVAEVGVGAEVMIGNIERRVIREEAVQEIEREVQVEKMIMERIGIESLLAQGVKAFLKEFKTFLYRYVI